MECLTDGRRLQGPRAGWVAVEVKRKAGGKSRASSSSSSASSSVIGKIVKIYYVESNAIVDTRPGDGRVIIQACGSETDRYVLDYCCEGSRNGRPN